METSVNKPTLKKVLIIQDNQTLLRELAAIMQQASYDVKLASDGEEGWAVFVTHEPDAVISAVRMPNLDGISLLRRIKNKTPDSKVILIASATNTEAEQEAQALGVTAFLYMPIQDSSVLLQLLNS